MSVDNYTPSGALKSAINKFHTAETKVEQASLNVAKALYGERESIANVGRKALAEVAGVSESRVSQWRATGDAIARGLSEEALLVINRGTGNGAGRVTSRVLREALAAVDNGKADAEEASAWVLANKLPGDETEEETEVETEAGQDGEAETEGAEVTDLERAINTLARLLSKEDDPIAAAHDALAQIAREVVPAEDNARKVFAGNLAKSIIA